MSQQLYAPRHQTLEIPIPPALIPHPTFPKSFKVGSYLIRLFLPIRLVLWVIAIVFAFAALLSILSKPASPLSAQTALQSTEYFQDNNVTFSVKTEKAIWLEDLVWIQFRLDIRGNEWNGNCTVFANSTSYCHLYAADRFVVDASGNPVIVTIGEYEWQ
jgi:hypothetical protein